jgi:Xaa-Pro aminopeptidase
MGLAEQYSERLANVRALMNRAGLDILVVGPSADLLYLTGAHHRPSERFAALLLPQQGPSSMVVPAFEAASLPTLPAECSIRTWGESDNPTRLAAGIISESIHAVPGGADVTIGVGERLWSVFLLRLQSELPRAAFTPATAVLSQARQVKTAGEVDLLAKAGARADAAFMEMIKQPFAGRKEVDVSHEFARLLEANGLTMGDTPIVGSGPNGASPHHHASDRVIQVGDAVVLDFFGTYEDYTADCTRTVWVGSAPAPESEEMKVYNTVARAQEAGVQSARPGITCEALDAVARNIITQAGYGEYFTHRLGHGIGLDGHEPPYLVHGNDVVLQDGMAFSVEPGIYLPGRFGVRIEDSVALVSGKALRFNNTDRGIVVVQ